jgi:hypothetical protein
MSDKNPGHQTDDRDFFIVFLGRSSHVGVFTGRPTCALRLTAHTAAARGTTCAADAATTRTGRANSASRAISGRAGLSGSIAAFSASATANGAWRITARHRVLANRATAGKRLLARHLALRHGSARGQTSEQKRRRGYFDCPC